MDAIVNESLVYIEDSGVGVLDLHLLSSFANESIIEGIFAGCLLLLPLVWLWYMRKVFITENSEIIAYLEERNVCYLEEGGFAPWFRINSMYQGEEIKIHWSVVLWWETCVVTYSGSEYNMANVNVEKLREIIQGNITSSSILAGSIEDMNQVVD